MTSSPPIPAAPATVIYDGTCRFCVAGSARLLKIAAPGRIERMSMHDPEVFRRFPTLTPEMCAGAMQLVEADGTVFSGVGAIVEALATRKWLRWTRWLYRLTPVRVVVDRLYRVVARNRHRIMGRVTGGDACESGACRMPGHEHGSS